MVGSVTLDPAALADSIQVQVEVDMASFDTGIELRNRHMRENHLHTDKYPKAVFRGGRLSNLSSRKLAEGAVTTGTITGEMELHGTKRTIEAPIELQLAKGVLQVTSRFTISLADYGIPRPQFLIMRLQDIQQVSLAIEARPRGPGGCFDAASTMIAPHALSSDRHLDWPWFPYISACTERLKSSRASMPAPTAQHLATEYTRLIIHLTFSGLYTGKKILIRFPLRYTAEARRLPVSKLHRLLRKYKSIQVFERA